ncbi:hypothetical protein ACJX0J_016900, partial [Zea mays]
SLKLVPTMCLLDVYLGWDLIGSKLHLLVYSSLHLSNMLAKPHKFELVFLIFLKQPHVEKTDSVSLCLIIRQTTDNNLMTIDTIVDYFVELASKQPQYNMSYNFYDNEYNMVLPNIPMFSSAFFSSNRTNYLNLYPWYQNFTNLMVNILNPLWSITCFTCLFY